MRSRDADLGRYRKAAFFFRVFRRKFFEHFGEDRDDEGDYSDQCHGGEAEDKQRVHQRRFHLTPQRVGFLHLEGDLIQRVFKPPRLLAGADHRPVEAVEHLPGALPPPLPRAAGPHGRPPPPPPHFYPPPPRLPPPRVQGAPHPPP